MLVVDERAAPGHGDCLLLRGVDFMRVVRMDVQAGRLRFLSMSGGQEIELDLDAVEFCGVVVGQYRRL
ncbi:hypothetical protein [Halotalea alkalilenta]|uniref:hypothetical protein n=1 Tax=Halotalea alkalilenta TaxID=376489 RepID=UPI0012376922|nr:hypothetical protein [Halotalea alkalilenta]